MKWGYIITFISEATGKTNCYKFKNAKSAWKAFCHWKRQYRYTKDTIILAKNTRIIEMKLPHVEIKSTKPNIEPLGGAKE
mgnify:CR=1 FL=1